MNLATLDPQEVRETLKKRGTLPTLPTTFAQLMHAAADQNTSFTELANIIAQDPVLTANVLRVANSGFIGLKQPVEDLSTAIVCLGFFEIRRAALAVGSFKLFQKKGAAAQYLTNSWIHSLATGMMSQRLAEICGFDDEGCYLGGLLHDIGKLFFSSTYPEVYGAVMERVSKGKGDILDLEKEVFGLTHLEAAAELCDHWKLPRPIRFVATDHHSLSQTPQEFRPLGLCVAVANVFAHHILKDEPVTARLPMVTVWVEELTSIPVQEIEALLMEQLEQIQLYAQIRS
jgi:putative nucleotidyltransferase with HDIG domain